MAAQLGLKVAFLCPEHMLSPESLPLHDVPQLTQVGLGNDIVWFQLESSQVVRFCFWKFSIQVEDGAEVHQSSWVLGEKNKRGKGMKRHSGRQSSA